MNYPRTLLALSLASALLLSGCGAGSGSTSSASSTLTDNTISERSLVQLRIGNEDVTLEPEQRYYSWSASDTNSGTEHFDLNTETVIRDWDQETMVTSAGIGLGVSLDYFMDAYHVQPNYAHLNYEYDPYGDGTTDKRGLYRHPARLEAEEDLRSVHLPGLYPGGRSVAADGSEQAVLQRVRRHLHCL